MSYVPVKAVSAFLWGKRVGVIVHAYDQYSRFEYDPEFRRSGLEIAPFAMPLSKAIYTADEFELPRRAFMGLPGLFADSLPDSFGNSVIDAWMEQQNVKKSSVTALDRLAYVGSRAMGALEYAPQRGPRRDAFLALRMKNVVEQSRYVLDHRIERMSGPDALKEIFRVGTSAGGAQAKSVVGWNPQTDKFCVPSEDMPDGFEHWIVKITPDERPYLGVAEYRTYELARACGVDISESRLYELDGVLHFMTRRFDRDGSRRHHLMTFRAMRTLPPDVSLEINSYGQLFETIVALGLGYDALSQMFRRMAKKNKYVLSKDVEKWLDSWFRVTTKKRDRHFGNGREVRNRFEKALERQSLRVSELKDPTPEQLTTLTMRDVGISLKDPNASDED